MTVIDFCNKESTNLYLDNLGNFEELCNRGVARARMEELKE